MRNNRLRKQPLSADSVAETEAIAFSPWWGMIALSDKIAPNLSWLLSFLNSKLSYDPFCDSCVAPSGKFHVPKLYQHHICMDKEMQPLSLSFGMKPCKIRGCFMPQLHGEQALPSLAYCPGKWGWTLQWDSFGSAYVFSVWWGDGGWASAGGFSLGRVVGAGWAGLPEGGLN